MNKYLGLLLLLVLCACKTAQPVVTAGNANTDKKITAQKVIDAHYAQKRDFVTAYIKAGVRYEDDKNKQSVTAEIRIKKNEMILVSIRLLGITMAKALITPKEVKYYEKINGSYFEGDYATLSQWLGTDLDFEKVQNLLIGQALENLKTGNYTTATTDNLYVLESDGATSKKYYFEVDQFLLRKQEISQVAQQRMMQVLYPEYTQSAEAVFPKALIIEADQKKGKTTINVEYNSVTFNEAMTFPYSVPDGYERIYIKP